MENKEIITIGTTFIVIVGIAMYMFISQQDNNKMAIEARELKTIMESHNNEHQAQLDSITHKLETIQTRLDETDEKFHK